MPGTLIDTTSLTKFGDMTSGGGLAAIFDLNSGSTGYSQSTTGYAGVQLSTSTPIEYAEFVSASNGFDASGSNTSVTLKLYGKQGSAPTGPTDGTLLGTSGPFTDINAVTTKVITCTDPITAWDYIWGTLNTGVWCVLSALKLYEVTPPPEPEQQISDVFSVKKSCNITVPLKWNTTEIPEFRQGVFVEKTAVATVNFQMGIIHNNLNGYTDAIGISTHLLVRSGTTWASTQAATFEYVPNAVSGGNIASLTDHYGTLTLIAKVPLDANKYYEFSVTGSAHSSASSSDGLASVLAEYGVGLNYFVITVDKNEVLIN